MIRQMVFSRNRYFQGRLLSASDFEAEQTYLRDKQRFRNLHMLGIGVVAGLSVTTSNHGTFVSVTPGYAIDNLGREICVPSPIECALPSTGTRLRVDISYVEIDSEPTTSALSPDPFSPDDPAEYTSVREGFELTLTPISPAKVGHVRSSLDKLSHNLTLAILRRKGKGWIVDRALKPKRMKKH
jgi:hypothetical protein